MSEQIFKVCYSFQYFKVALHLNVVFTKLKELTIMFPFIILLAGIILDSWSITVGWCDLKTLFRTSKGSAFILDNEGLPK
jgi:hypothetical protein